MERSLSKKIIIQSGVLEYINKIIENKNKFIFKENTLKRDHLVFLVFLLNKIITRKKNKFESDEGAVYTPLLRGSFISRYKVYISFLEEKELILKKHSYRSGVSNIYQFTDFYKSLDKSFTTYIIRDRAFLKKFSHNNSTFTEYQYTMNKLCRTRRKHLVKNFDRHLTMDINGAQLEIKDFSYKKFVANSFVINEFENKEWKYSIKEETDNRLHTVITRTNKKLLQYITYKEHELSEIDVKSSQPLFLYAILKALYSNESSNNFLNIFLKDKLDNKLRAKLEILSVDIEKIDEFGSLIVLGDLYNHLISRINIQTDKKGKFYRTIIKESSPPKKKYYNTKRELVKEVVMEALYSGNRNSHKEVKAIKKVFPEVFSIIKVINKNSPENYLSKLLQNVEAHVLLDLIAKEVSVNFDEIPLFSKHDSLITYSSKIDEVKYFVNEKMNVYLNIEGELFKSNSWKKA